jgi:hypothetical protein
MAAAILLVLSTFGFAIGCDTPANEKGPVGLEACADVKNEVQCEACCMDEGAIGHEFNERGTGEQPCRCEVRAANQPS